MCLLPLLLVSVATSAERCREDWACWEVRKIDGNFEFWVKNLKPDVFTASMEVETRNLKSEQGTKRRFEAAEVIPGHTSTKILTLYPVRSDRRASYQDIFYWTPGDMRAHHDVAVSYRAPFAKGESYSLVQGFGGGWSHSGASKYAVDFAMPIGTAVHASRAGKVVQVVSKHSLGGSSRRYAEYANYVVILHDDGTTGEYYHLMKNGVVVAVDEEVEAGQHIGYSGNTGFSSLPHLHFAVYRPKPLGDFESLPFKFEAGIATRRSWWWD